MLYIYFTGGYNTPTRSIRDNPFSNNPTVSYKTDQIQITRTWSRVYGILFRNHSNKYSKILDQKMVIILACFQVVDCCNSTERCGRQRLYNWILRIFKCFFWCTDLYLQGKILLLQAGKISDDLRMACEGCVCINFENELSTRISIENINNFKINSLQLKRYYIPRSISVFWI